MLPFLRTHKQYRQLGIILVFVLFFAPSIQTSAESPPTPEPKPVQTTSFGSGTPDIELEVKQLIANSPKPSELPGDAAVFLLKEEEDFVHPDGTSEMQFHEVVKILQESGKAFSKLQLPYNQSKEEIEIITARTIKPDGKIVNTDLSLIQDTTAFSQVPLFDDLRVRQFILPDVSVGDCLELKYTIRIKKPVIKSVFTTFFSFPLGFAILRSRLIVNVPADMKLNYVVTIPGSKNKPWISQKEDRTTYQWTPDPSFPTHAHEPAIPPSFDVDPYVFLSTMESWDQLTKWYVPLFEENIKEGIDKIKVKTDEIISTAGANREKIIKALSKFVSQEVNYVRISLGESAWRPYPPDYVLNNRYADCKGKSALLIAMLRSVGIDAFAVLIKPSSAGRLILEVPSLDFSHMIVAIPKPKGGYLFVDPTLQGVPYDYLTPFEEDRDVIILDKFEAHFEKTPKFPISISNQVYSTLTAMLSADGSAEVEQVDQKRGLEALSSRMMLRQTNPSLLHDLFENGIRKQYPGSILKSFQSSNLEDVNEPLIFTFKGTFKGLAQVVGNMLLVDQDHVVDPTLVSLVTFDQRVYPLFLGVREERIWEGTYTIPEGYAPKSIPANLSISKPFGFYGRYYNWVDGKLTGKIKVVVDQLMIPVEQYSEFKKFVEKIDVAEKEKIIFEKGST